MAMELANAREAHREACSAQDDGQNRRDDPEAGQEADRVEVMGEPSSAEAQDDQDGRRNHFRLTGGVVH
jgi:hypothetical protein